MKATNAESPLAMDSSPPNLPTRDRAMKLIGHTVFAVASHAAGIAVGYYAAHVLTHEPSAPVVLKDKHHQVVPGERGVIIDQETGDRLQFSCPGTALHTGLMVTLPANFLEQNSR